MAAHSDLMYYLTEEILKYNYPGLNLNASVSSMATEKL